MLIVDLPMQQEFCRVNLMREVGEHEKTQTERTPKYLRWFQIHSFTLIVFLVPKLYVGYYMDTMQYTALYCGAPLLNGRAPTEVSEPL